MAAPMHSPHTGDIFTGGGWHPPLGRSVQRVINPATEEVIAEDAMGDTRDLDRATRAAAPGTALTRMTGKPQPPPVIELEPMRRLVGKQTPTKQKVITEFFKPKMKILKTIFSPSTKLGAEKL